MKVIVGALKKGQRAWAEKSLDERIGCLARFGRLLEENREDLAKTLTLEVGKPIRESRNEVNGALYRVRYFIEHSKKYLEPKILNEASGVRELLIYEPLGVVAHISAWNYPYLIAMNVLPPALIGGNAVLYKPSEYSTLSGLQIVRCLHEAGIPKDVLQTVVGGGSVGKALLALPLDGYFFTGSYKTGQSIAKALRDRLVPVTLELGGKDPLYIADDIENVTKVAASAVEGSFYNCGQSCCAVERIYVHRRIYKSFVRAFVEETKKIKMGDPMDERTTLGPVTRPMHLKFLSHQVKDALKRGARLLLGGKPVLGKGAFFEPTVLVKVDHSMSLMKDETFGPVIGIQKVRDDDDAIRLMQDTEYGLTAAIYSKSEDRAKSILQKLDVGTGYWNCCDRVTPFLPWSGRRRSGLGVTLSQQGIHAFVRSKGYHLKSC